ncbi:SDR family NAD(P)-dependent oxidoreductase [Limnochorda pilosa]|uniref:3-oxoacyl-ACP synthase n=1 Tax=Limnochorda pilosa TaxID=1555112 RepID=A0A0K2SJQ3_LIMPI|nr:3-oxoacyl-ACP reductase family protein [Limnochorda pilosa]BAS27079.1 3-oxoacyl-ACP synthase [Limnochorda pilosa]
MRRLEGQVALVTGASRGIGAAIARALAAEGARVGVNYRAGRDGAEAVVEGIRGEGGEATALAADVASPDDVHRMVAAVDDRWGRLDVLVANAGVALDVPFRSMNLQAWTGVLEVNLTGVFLCAREAVPLMERGGGGRIITVSAGSALRGRVGGANYCASKAGVIALTRCLALELAPAIRVNCLVPGFTATDEVLDRFGLRDPARREALEREVPLGRLAEPEDIARAAVYLAAEAGYVTGQLLLVNGGHFMY